MSNNIKANIKNLILNILPIVIIFFISFCASYILFKYKGINTGDDYVFHIANVQELVDTIMATHGFSDISGYIADGLGYGIRIFYSNLSHITVAYTAVIFNLDVIDAFKVVIYVSVFLSGVVCYFFGLKISKNNKLIGLIFAAIYICYPYRMFDAFCRFAFAEAFSFIFIPLFFMGLYEVSHMNNKEIRVLPFIEIILGASLLYLSHNITAMYAYVLGVIFLLFHIKNIVITFKQSRRYLIYIVVSIVMIIGIAGVKLFGTYEQYALNYYNVSDPAYMVTSVAKVSSRAGQEMLSYSGFLNMSWISGRNYYTINNLIIEVILLAIFSLIYILIDNLLKNLNILKFKSKYTNILNRAIWLLASTIVFIIVTYMFIKRDEVIISMWLLVVLYITASIIYAFDKNEINTDKLYANPSLWFVLFTSIILLFMMYNADVWKYVPQIFRSIQFPWRLWAFIQFNLAYGLALVLSYTKNKALRGMGLALASFFIAVSMPLVEKRCSTYQENKQTIKVNTDEVYLSSGSIGWNKEYIPQIYRESGYESKYINSLYFQMKAILMYKNTFNGNNFDKLDPVILGSDGTANIVSHFADEYTITFNSDGEGYIQIPLIYYKGYYATIVNNDTGKSKKLKATDIDGIVAFSIEEGNYTIYTKYEGTTIKKLSKVYYVLSLSGLMCFGLYGASYKMKRYKREELY